MVKRIRKRFILLAMAALLILLSGVVVGMNLINYSSLVSELDEVLGILSKNRGGFPEYHDKGFDGIQMSPEIPFETRFFSVQVNEDGEIIHTETEQIVSVSTEEANTYADAVFESGKTTGFYEGFRFMRTNDFFGSRITFLDAGRKLESFYDFLFSSVLMSVIGYAAMSVVIIVMSAKVVRPVAESYEKQRRFITDAGHEIKTPLTIINANVDVLESELEEGNESLSDIKAQTKRLSELTGELVYLSRMEENQEKLEKIDFPISEIVSDTASSFNAIAKTEKKEIIQDIEPMLTMCGDTKSIEKLVSILLNNALKYSPENSKIKVSLKRVSKNLILSVENESAYKLDPERMNLVFDRFYREDISRNSDVPGYGIGLSIAKTIVKAHEGKISAALVGENSFKITAVFKNGV